MLNKCLGRKPAVHDPRTVKLTDLAPSMQYYNPLHECLRASEVATWLMGDNDRFGDCHDDQTEVLTSTGWQKWEDYDNSPLATLNIELDTLEYQMPIRVIKKHYEGPMHYTGHNGLDFAVTPTHRMLNQEYSVKNRSYGNLHFTPIKDLKTRVVLPTAPSNGFDSEGCKDITIGKTTWAAEDFIKLLSLVISDGWVGGTDSNKNKVSFCCFQESKTFVREFAESIGANEYPSRKNVWLINDPALAGWFRQNIYVGQKFSSSFKKLPEYLRTANKNQIELFLKFYGDQHAHEGGSIQYYTSSKNLADGIQEILFKIGTRASLSTRDRRDSVSVNSEGREIVTNFLSYIITCRVRAEKLTLTRLSRLSHHIVKPYVGFVYCAEVPNSTLVTRRNDKILISGNCTSVGIANTLLARSIFAGHTNPPTTADILSFYERFGFIPGDPATDQGATLIECIQSWMRQGYPVRGTANKLLGYASIDPHNHTLMHAAIEIFGDVYIGVTLDEAQQTQTTWDYVAGSATWGGHCISCNAFDSNGLYRVTSWAEWLPVTKNFMDQQCDEAYVLLDAASIRKGQMTFSDWNMAALEAAIKSLGGLDTAP